MVLCGSLERNETTSWGDNGSVGRLENDAKTGWCLECCVATGVFEGKSVFKLGVSAPVIEVYIVGCCRGVPVILTKTVLVSPRKKASRYAILDAIPEDEELDNRRQNGVISNGLVRQRKVQGGAVFCNVVKDWCISNGPLVQITEAEGDDGYDSDEKLGNRYYSGDMYYGKVFHELPSNGLSSMNKNS
ncbi:hypothetical protein DKX38_003178 [Salix brachista]|uniref:Uncharacterized protein n=1 Tax=Salix brachista TaxID=2182728 RepID=A0A5N5NP83_9ROSI|nr:hypothetical protein DKX38_003178 [Salix brachista]